MRRSPYLLSLATALLTSSTAVLPTAGCGSCKDIEVTDLAVVPPQSCIVVEATEVDACNYMYGINVTNTCQDDLVVEGRTITSGNIVSFAGLRANDCEQCSFDGLLGDEPFAIQWTMVHHEP
jgi:hypothetical protein